MRTPTRGRFAAITAIAASVTLALAACSSAATPSASAPAAEEGDGTVTVGVAFYNSQLPLYVGMRKGMEAAAEEAGVELVFADAQNDAAAQKNQINNFISLGVDAILASPADAAALVSAYQDAQDAGIPIFSVGNRVADEAVETAFIGADYADMAEETMRRVAEGVDGEGEVVLVTGPPESALAQQQKEGWQRVLDENPGMTVVDTQVVPDLSKAGALPLVVASLSAHPDVSVVVGSNDQIALGAVAAAQQLGLGADDLFIAAWNTPPDVLAAIKEGNIDVTMSLKPLTWGEIALTTVLDYLNGTEPAEHDVKVEDIFVDAENIATITEADVN